MAPKQWWLGTTAQQHSAVLVDIDSAAQPDSRLEVLVSNGWEVSVIDSQGRQLTWDGVGDNPASLPTYLTSYSLVAPPAVGDVDGDGQLELVAGGASSGGNQAAIYVWALGSSEVTGSAAEWPMYKRSSLRSSLLDTGKYNDAIVVGLELPDSLLPRACGEARVTFRNVGLSTWRTDTNHRLGALGESSEVFSLASRLSLSQATGAGDEATYQFQLCAPSDDGYYTLDLRMVQDGVGWFGARVLRKIRVGNAPAFHVLHTSSGGTGGVVPEGLAEQIAPPDYNHWGNVRAFALKHDGAGYYLLDGPGGDVIWAGTAEDVGSVGTSPAVDIELSPDGQGYYLVDAYGRLSLPSSSPDISPRPPTFGDDRVRSLAVVPGSRVGVYVLDKYGRVYAGGGAQLPAPGTPVFDAPIAKRIQVQPDGTGYYVLDAYGRVHNGGGAPPISPNYDHHLGEDWARDFELTDDGEGYFLLDRSGQIHTGGNAVDYPERNPVSIGMGEAIDLEVYDSGFRTAVFDAAVDANSVWMVGQNESDLPSVTFPVRNLGMGGALNWTASVVQGGGWLQVTPDQGDTPDQVTIRVSDLPSLGDYQGAVDFHASDGQQTWETTLTVNVRLIVVERVTKVHLPTVTR
ncbi:MAG: hypothetical protein JXC32_16955, partial [Anaerolineae bacterium]|nr:hypothetical protein [Anaerolineae bacterium]